MSMEMKIETAQCDGGDSQTLAPSKRMQARNFKLLKLLKDFLYPLHKEHRTQYRADRDCLRDNIHNKHRADNMNGEWKMPNSRVI